MANVVSISAANQPGLISILIPCVGMLEYTKLCVPSVLRYSREPFELIFLDIGATDGTTEYLAGLHAGLRGSIRIEVLRVPIDDGIPLLCKAGLKEVHGDYVCLLNNDTVVTFEWLQALLGLLRQSDNLGMVGPMSNCAAKEQLVEGVPYRVGPRKGSESLSTLEPLVELSEVQSFAREFTRQHAGNYLHAERLGGFCAVVKGMVLRKILPELEECTTLSVFDTDILSAKVRQAGYKLAVCRDLFIHHFGTRTFVHGAPPPAENGQQQGH